MAKLALSLWALTQLSLVYGRPAAELEAEQHLDERDVPSLTSLEPTTSYSTAIQTLQSVSITVLPSITGSIQTALPSGGFTNDPLKPGGTSTGKFLCPLETPLEPGPTAPLNPISSNIFQPIATGTPPRAIPALGGHYVKKEHIVDEDVPIQTNKFYANFFLGGQGNPVWVHPYHLSWSKGNGQTRSYGMAISHTERSQFAFGPQGADPPQYFISPIGINHIVLSAAELGRDTVLSVEELKAFSVYANLAPNATSPAIMTLPCVQGMGFITAIYNSAKPVINSGVFFRTFDLEKDYNNGVTYKWRITLNDNSQWLLYVTPIGSVGIPPFTLEDSATISGPRDFKGMVQVAKNPSGQDGEEAFDAAAGAYATSAEVSGNVNGRAGSYTLAWKKGGIQSQTLLMYALPHHVESFDGETKLALRNMKLVTTTKGYAQAVLADRITMVENDLPDTIGFAPWAKNPNSNGGSGNVNLQAGALALVNSAGHAELSQNFVQQTSLNSMYYSGKGLAKFAGIVYTMNSIAGNRELAAAGLAKLKDAFNVFVNNTQPEPLVYDTVWKGVVSFATYRPINGGPGDPGLDFGNTLYNDHHFHYGYFVYTAAVIGYLDPSWLEEGSNKAYVNTLVRDFANPVADREFPFQRSFDWYHGHSWAKGLFESGDGKDQESTSEDTFATYAIKMWGKIIRDANMEARGNLQLAVQARSMKNYFLLTQDNKNQPPQFLPNKVTGILFENKIDHTTYFGSNIEYIQGIHMIPLNPSSAYTRSRKYVTEEWNKYFNGSALDHIQGGWKAILYANLALIDPQRAYDFFADPEFNTQLDGGASRTWYLAYTAALLNAENGRVEKDPNLYYDGGGDHDADTATYSQIVAESTLKAVPVAVQTLMQSPAPAPVGTLVQRPVQTPAEVPIQTPPSATTGGWPVGFVWPKASSNAPQQGAASSPPEARPIVQPSSLPKNGRPRPRPSRPRPPPKNGNSRPSLQPVQEPADNTKGTWKSQSIPDTNPAQRLQIDNDDTTTLDMSWALQDRSFKED